MKIVILDRENNYAKGLRYYLQQAGHQVLLVTDASELRELVRHENPDLVVVDHNDLEIAGTRPFAEESAQKKLPFVVPATFDLAPLSDPEMDQSRICDVAQRQQAEAIMRRLRKFQRGRIARVRVGGLSVNFDRKLASFDGHPLQLTPLQFKLLGVLALNAKRVVGYGELLEQVWGFEGEDEEARELLKAHVNRIRRKLKAAAPDKTLPIHAVRGFGYTLGGSRSRE